MHAEIQLIRAGFVLAALPALLFTLLLSCGPGPGTGQPDLPGKTGVITVAERLEINKEKSFTKVTIKNPWQGAENVDISFILVRKGELIPPGTDTSKVIMVPVEHIVCLSTTHVAMISALGREDALVGMSGTGFLYSPSLRKRASEGLIADVGYESNMNKELIISLKPDLTMIYGVGSESAGYVGKISELGLKVIYNADYLETDPLAKAEWIKLFGALFCLENRADSIFTAEKASYDSLKKFVESSVTTHPKVLLGLPFKDTWFVSPGNSYISRLLNDAGAAYIWNDTRSEVSMPMGLESVYLRAASADYWLNTGTAGSRDEVIAVDRRLGRLKCFIDKNLYNNNNRVSESGGNDFWESGAVYPHLILNDLAAILHPELFPGYNLVYYRKLD